MYLAHCFTWKTELVFCLESWLRKILNVVNGGNFNFLPHLCEFDGEDCMGTATCIVHASGRCDTGGVEGKGGDEGGRGLGGRGGGAGGGGEGRGKVKEGEGMNQMKETE